MAELFELDTNKTSSASEADAPAKPTSAEKPKSTNSDEIAQDQLRAFIERIERMEEEKKAISDDIREIYSEAKGNGFDTKVLRQVIKIRKQDAAERAEQEALLDLYLVALGMAAAG
jgi:uncharacterized protein (UPF0335 family)